MFDKYLINEAATIFEEVVHVSKKELVIIAANDIYVIEDNEQLEKLVFDNSLPFC